MHLSKPSHHCIFSNFKIFVNPVTVNRHIVLSMYKIGYFSLIGHLLFIFINCSLCVFKFMIFNMYLLILYKYKDIIYNEVYITNIILNKMHT